MGLDYHIAFFPDPQFNYPSVVFIVIHEMENQPTFFIMSTKNKARFGNYTHVFFITCLKTHVSQLSCPVMIKTSLPPPKKNGPLELIFHVHVELKYKDRL